MNDDRKREELRITPRFSSLETGKMRLSLSEMAKTESNRSGGKDPNFPAGQTEFETPAGHGQVELETGFTGPQVKREITVGLREQKIRNLLIPSRAVSTVWRGLAGGLEGLNTCAPNRGRTERKYGNPARTPPAPAAPTRELEEVRGPGPRSDGAGYPGSLGEARGDPGLRKHASEAEQGLLGLGGGSALEVWVSSLSNGLDSFP